MKEKLYTIPINDAFGKDSECHDMRDEDNS